MAQTFGLDIIIQVVSAQTTISSAEQKVVVIDVESGKAVETIDSRGRKQLERVGFLKRFSERKYLLVSNNLDRRKEAEGTVDHVLVRDFQHNWTLDLQVRYLASCNPGDEVKAAEALWRGTHPGAALHEAIRRWVRDYAGTNPAKLIEKYYEKKSDLETYVSSQALKEVGLNLQVTAEISAEQQALQSVEIGPMHIPVRVKDHSEDQDLKLKAEVQADPDRKIYAVLHRAQNSRLEELLKNSTRKYFAENVSLHAFHTGLRHDRIRDGLAAELNAALSPFGQKLRLISLKHGEKKQIQTFYEKQQDVLCEIQEYSKPIIIKNAIQMTLEDYGRFRSSGVESLDQWLEESLEHVIRQVLFDKKYIDLLIGFDKSEVRIKDQMRARAKLIGYDINQLITGPDLEQYLWLKYFTLQLKEEFGIKNSKFPVRLNIVITAKIGTLEDVREYLNRSQNVPDEIKAAIRQEAAQFLHTVDPKRFYLRFSYTNEENELPVEKVLDTNIRKRLVDDFKADIVSLTLEVGDTELTALYDQLRKTPGEFRVELSSYDVGLVYDVVLVGKFRVESVHYEHWDTFQSTDPSVEKIQAHLQDHLKALLNVLPYGVLAYQTLAQQQELGALIESLARQRILTEFGLVIAVHTVSREITQRELGEKERTRGLYEQDQEHQKLRTQNLIETITDLEFQRLELKKANAKEDEITRVEQIIAGLKDELPVNRPPAKTDFKKLLQPATYTPTSLQDYYSPTKAIGAPTVPVNENGDQEVK